MTCRTREQCALFIMALIPYFELIKIPGIFYRTMGQQILEQDANNPKQSKYLRILFFATIFNYNLHWLLQLIYFFSSIRAASMLELTAVAPCIGFGLVGNFKQMTLHMNKLKIRGVLKDLDDLYPKTKNLQDDYSLRDYVEPTIIVMKIYAVLCLWNTAYFGFFPLGKNVVAILFHGAEFEYPFGFYIWHPFDPTRNWFVYVFCYGLQMWAGTLIGIGVLTADLFLVSSVIQLCFQFDYISKRLERYHPRSGTEEDRKFMKDVLKCHMKCLELSDVIDKVFSFSLLLNFLTSSATICFVGFQVITSSTEELLRYSVLLTTSLVQVMVICIYGNKLIDASQAVGDAAFAQPWYDGDSSYKKMILLIICRSQKAAAIHAPTFPPISLQTFMKVVSMAYQIFAVLQTTYSNQ